nr:hypothetical protein [Tanacetum cinerariifolium]
TTAWNEFSSTIASAVICLATDQKFNFFKYIFDSMVKNLDSATKCLMFPRFVQVILNNQLEEMANHTRIYVPPSHTKKIFRNMKRVGKGFSGRDTPRFLTMMVQPQEELDANIAIPIETHVTPIITQPSSPQHLRKQKPRKTRRQDTENNKDCLSKRDFKFEKESQEIREEKEVRNSWAKKIDKVGLATRVESSADEKSLGEEDASKQGRIYDIDANQDIYMTLKPKAKGIVMQEPSETPTLTPIVSSQQPSKVHDKGKGIMVEPDMPMKKKAQISLDEELAFKDCKVIYEIQDLFDKAMKRVHMFVDMDTKVVESTKKDKAETVQESSSKRAGDEREQESSKKQKIEDENESSELKRCLEIVLDDGDDGIVMQEPSETPTPTPIVSSQQPSKVHDKGKGIMVEPDMHMKKKAQISLDEELAFKLLAEEDKQERIV